MRIGRIMSLVGVAIVCCFSIWRAGGNEPPNSKVWNFDKDKVGEVAQGLSSESGEWKVVADETAPSKGQVLAQLAKSDKEVFNVILAKDTKAKQMDISVKFKAVAGKEDQGGGVIWRAKDAKNYFLCGYNHLEDNLRVYKVVDGKRTILATFEIEHTEGWHSMRATMRDGWITIFYDDEARTYFFNDAFMDAGMVGLWTKGDAQTHFDDMVFIDYQ